MKQREAEHIVVQCARRVCYELGRPVSIHSADLTEALGELRNAVANLEEVEKPARHAARHHTEGRDW